MHRKLISLLAIAILFGTFINPSAVYADNNIMKPYNEVINEDGNKIDIDNERTIQEYIKKKDILNAYSYYGVVTVDKSKGIYTKNVTGLQKLKDGYITWDPIREARYYMVGYYEKGKFVQISNSNKPLFITENKYAKKGIAVKAQIIDEAAFKYYLNYKDGTSDLIDDVDIAKELSKYVNNMVILKAPIKKDNQPIKNVVEISRAEKYNTFVGTIIFKNNEEDAFFRFNNKDYTINVNPIYREFLRYFDNLQVAVEGYIIPDPNVEYHSAYIKSIRSTTFLDTVTGTVDYLGMYPVVKDGDKEYMLYGNTDGIKGGQTITIYGIKKDKFMTVYGVVNAAP